MKINRVKSGAVAFQSFVLAFVFTGSFAQEIVKVRGIVVDAATGIALSHVRIESEISTVLTDTVGYFAVSARERDSLFITHIGYHDLLLSINSETDTLRITLERNTYILKEVTINALPSEDELKAKILETTVTPTREEENAQANLQDIRTLWSLGYRPELDAMQNFREAMKPPEGATILSSKGGGLVKALKNLANPPVVSFPQRRQYSKPMTSLSFFKPRVPEKDSVQVDSLAFRFKIQNSKLRIPD